MDIAKCKGFIFDSQEENKMYKSKDLQKLIDMNEGNLYFIYGILETESGDTLMNLDWSYSNEPITMGRFIHLDYYLKYYWFKDIIEL